MFIQPFLIKELTAQKKKIRIRKKKLIPPAEITLMERESRSVLKIFVEKKFESGAVRSRWDFN